MITFEKYLEIAEEASQPTKLLFNRRDWDWQIKTAKETYPRFTELEFEALEHYRIYFCYANELQLTLSELIDNFSVKQVPGSDNLTLEEDGDVSTLSYTAIDGHIFSVFIQDAGDEEDDAYSIY